MKKLLIFFTIFLFTFSLYAQVTPGNNLGKGLSTMRQEFPSLRYLRTDDNGDLYEDGYPEDGIAMFFYFRNGSVVEECMICESNDGFSKIWYDSLWNNFYAKYSYAVVENTYNSKVFDFRTFKIRLIFFSESGKDTALLVYNY